MKLNGKNLFSVDLPSFINEFNNYQLSIKGKSLNTIRAYTSDLILFLKFMVAYKKGFLKDDIDSIDISNVSLELIKSIKLQDLIAFISYTETYRDNSAYARARKVASIKSFFKYLYCITKEIDINPAEELESPKISKRNPAHLNLDESVQLLNSITGTNKKRDKCIITFFLNCGLRLSELCNINLDDIKDDTISVIGKGNKERTIYLNNACIRALNEYLVVRETLTDKLPSEHKNALFISNKHMRISNRSVERLVKKHIGLAGLDSNKYSPHKLRHTAATLLYNHGDVDIRSLQKILGHENVATTQIYTHVDDEKLREASLKNPLNDL